MTHDDGDGEGDGDEKGDGNGGSDGAVTVAVTVAVGDEGTWRMEAARRRHGGGGGGGGVFDLHVPRCAGEGRVVVCSVASPFLYVQIIL